MEENPDRFIPLATRAMAESDREAAADELRARIAHAGGEEEAARAAGRLTAVPPAWRLPMIVGIGFAVLAVALAFLIAEHWREARLLVGIHGQGRDNQLIERVIAEMGPDADVPLRALYHADQHAWREQVEAVSAERPDDPAYYRHRVEWYSYMYPGQPYPPDYRERWKALDPDNALWAISAAEAVAQKALTRGPRGAVSITDEPRFQEALGWLREAAACSRFELPRNVIRERQLRSFHDDSTRKAAAMKQALTSQVREENPGLYNLIEVVAIDAERKAAAGDREDVKRHIADLRKIVQWIVEADPQRDKWAIYPFRKSGVKLEAACLTLGLTEEAAWVRSVIDLAHRRAMVRTPASTVARGESSRHPRAAGTPGVTAEDLTPARMAEHAVAGRFMVVSGVLLTFVLLAGGSVEMFRRGTFLRGMARGVAPVLRTSDLAWVIGLGGIAPVLWWIGIVHFSPLGCRDIGLAHFGFNQTPLMQPWLSQGLGGLVLLLAMLLQTVRWRLARRFAFLSLAAPRLWVGWVMVAVAALFIPVQGVVRYLPAHPEKFLLYGSAAGGIALLWLLWRGAMALFTPRDQALGGVLALRLLLPAWMAVGLALLAAVPLLRGSERAWMAQDTLSREVDGVSGLVRKYLAAIEPERRELLELLK